MRRIHTPRWALLGSAYTSQVFFQPLRLCSAVLCEFGTDRARNMEALLPKRTPRQVLHVLVRRKIGGGAMPRKSLILFVDDEWNGLEGRKMLFEEAGWKVLVASSGAEALQLFASNPVDLVLLDYHMPGMNGDVVAAHMKASQSDVPI